MEMKWKDISDTTLYLRGRVSEVKGLILAVVQPFDKKKRGRGSLMVERHTDMAEEVINWSLLCNCCLHVKSEHRNHSKST